MRRRQRRGDEHLLIGAWLLAALVVLGFATTGAWAQNPPAAGEGDDAPVATTDANDPTAPPAETADAEEAPLEGAFTEEELQALVAPVALYPDLVLVLVLQASLAPLDVVQADRFLADYAEDPSLAPDEDWDDSVIGLLNYPSAVETMSGDLDWTESLGTAVIEQLEGVQDAIQEFRGFMRAVGALESNEQMTVIAEGDVIRIEPADETAVFIPQYDPDALLAALYSTDVPPEPAAPEGETVASEEVVEEEAVAGSEAVAESEERLTEEGAAFESAPAPVAEPAPAVVPAAAPAYYPAVAPPPVTYSDPSPSWLGTAATFAGGAAVGGLVGWAIADDDDDDDGDRYSRGNIDIEDSTITINRGDGDELDELQRRVQDERQDREALQEAKREQTKLKAQNAQLERDARKKEEREQAKRQLQERYPEQRQRTAGGARDKVPGLAASGGQQRAVGRESAGSRQVAARVDRAKAQAAPRRPAAKAAPARGGKAVRAGDRRQPQVASAFGGTKKSTREAKRDSDRGLKSRSRAKTTVKPNRSGGGQSAFAQHGGGKKARAGNRGGGGKGRRGRK